MVFHSDYKQETVVAVESSPQQDEKLGIVRN
jgi:hypothetical protein